MAEPPVAPTPAAPSAAPPWEDFRGDWTERWKEMRLARTATDYEVTSDSSGSILHGTSVEGASVLLRQVEPDLAAASTLEWRWRVAGSLSENRRERTKEGDDYAARVFVIFGSGELNADTRALSYVWAANEPVGSEYGSPFAENVATIVVESGDEHAGVWRMARVDILADYRRVFGREADRAAAIALMVDTDNTESRARASFDFIELGGAVHGAPGDIGAAP
ncbi:MAG: DUF3047 domain-containing protein [Gemmatimonadota bacterium]